MGFVLYALALCQMNHDLPKAFGIGKLAMQFLDQFESTDIVARVHFLYYGFVAQFFDPVQSCCIKLKEVFETGMSKMDTFSAFSSAVQYVRLSIIGGTKLPGLLRETDYYLSLAKQHEKLGNMPRRYFVVYKETIATLIDNKKESIKKDDDETELEDPLHVKRLSETIYFHKALESYWLGHAERSHHYASKFLSLKDCGRHHRLIITFYHGINTLHVLRRRRSSKLRSIPKAALTELSAAAQHSKWNFRNKVHLLQAELSSYKGKNGDAERSYAAAISSSDASSFIHEQGLSCELAGLHHKRNGDVPRACIFFRQAIQCYTKWGSNMKVESVTQQLGMLGA